MSESEAKFLRGKKKRRKFTKKLVSATISGSKQLRKKIGGEANKEREKNNKEKKWVLVKSKPDIFRTGKLFGNILISLDRELNYLQNEIKLQNLQ